MKAALPLAIAVMLAAASPGAAIPKPTDLLLGYGDFEVADVLTWWDASYTGADFDWEAPNVWAWGSPGNRTGYSLPAPDDSIGNGWRRATHVNVNPGKNILFRVATGGLNGSKCQYFALKNLDVPALAVLLARIDLSRAGSDAHGGDTVTFKLDHVRMDDYDGANAIYSLRLRPATDASTWAQSTLSKSSTPFSTEISATLPANPATVTPEVIITVDPGTSGHTPGIYIDGAHLFIKRAGQAAYDTRDIPAVKNRTIKTVKMFCNTEGQDEYATAREFDYIILSHDASLSAVPALRAANPEARIYLYKGALVYRSDLGGKDHYYAGALGYRYVVSAHPEWLYSDGLPSGGYVNNQDYPGTYYARCSNQDYQREWADKLLAKIGGFRLDGIFLDDVFTCQRQPPGSGAPILRPDIQLWENQQFLHAVVPRLAAAGLDVIQNSASRFLASGEGVVYFDPFWSPSPPYDAPQYSPNNPSTVASLMQEWAFLEMEGFVRVGSTSNYSRNIYRKDYWKQCLDDMDRIREWNTATGTRAIPANLKRRLFMLAIGVDNPDSDPAYGVDGWLQFGLCSYLLGQNEWTVFGCGLRSTYSADVDYSITRRLGEPDGAHLAYEGDAYFRYRRYKPSVGGAAGGVVVVNANPDSPRTYRIDFDGTDEQGNSMAAGQQIEIKPHSGRIFLKQKGPVFVQIRVPSESVDTGEVVTVTVDYLNSSTQTVQGVMVRAIVPADMSYVPGSAEISGGSYDPVTSSVSWRIGTVTAEHSGRRTYKARVK